MIKMAKLNPNAVRVLEEMSNEELAKGIGHAIVMVSEDLEKGDPVISAALLVLYEAQKRIAALDK